MGNSSVILTFANVGDKIIKTAELIQRKGGNMPTPEEIDIDNVILGPDGLTNYAWLCREAYKFLGWKTAAQVEAEGGKI